MCFKSFVPVYQLLPHFCPRCFSIFQIHFSILHCLLSFQASCARCLSSKFSVIRLAPSGNNMFIAALTIVAAMITPIHPLPTSSSSLLGPDVLKAILTIASDWSPRKFDQSKPIPQYWAARADELYRYELLHCGELRRPNFRHPRKSRSNQMADKIGPRQCSAIRN